MTFRPLTLADLGSAMKLEQSMPPSTEWFPVNEEYQGNIIKNGLNFGVFENKALIGKVGFTSPHDQNYEVDGMVIEKKYRNKGIGKLLFEYALNQLINTLHPKKVFLFTSPKNVIAIAFYQKFGFEYKETILNKYGPGMHRIRMEKEIL